MKRPLDSVPAKIVRELTEQEMNWKIEGTRTYQALTVRSLATMVEAVALDAVEPDRRRIDVPQLLPLSDLKRRADGVPFRLDPETAHHLAIGLGARLGGAAGAMRAMTHVDDARLSTIVAGLHFQSPVGLAAGFDKSGTAVRALAGLGFGSVEIGSISIDPSLGNPKPRLWRLPDDEAEGVVLLERRGHPGE